MFQPLGVIFRLIKYGIVQGTVRLLLLPTGSRGLQLISRSSTAHIDTYYIFAITIHSSTTIA